MKSKTCCFTGHRSLPDSDLPTLTKRLESELTTLIHQGVCYFGAGGAMGFDTLAALTVLRLKSDFPHIKLILVLPCKDQEINWPIQAQKQYHLIHAQADKVVYTAQQYYKGCMHRRNRHLVSQSSTCLCYLTRTAGGTAYTVDYAKSQGLRVINLAEED